MHKKTGAMRTLNILEGMHCSYWKECIVHMTGKNKTPATGGGKASSI